MIADNRAEGFQDREAERSSLMRIEEVPAGDRLTECGVVDRREEEEDPQKESGKEEGV